MILFTDSFFTLKLNGLLATIFFFKGVEEVCSGLDGHIFLLMRMLDKG
jgi:hypothetical protein